jgi:AbrB family looped-hinge helix DNA binding protein
VYTATVSTKGWIVIPKELRERYGLKKGTRVRLMAYAQALVLVPLPDDSVSMLHGMLAEGPSLVEELLAERAREHPLEEPRRG